jgi:hypothetical protein
MALAQKIRTKDRFYVKVPEEMAKDMPDEMEIFMLKDGYFVLTPVLGAKQPAPKDAGEEKKESPEDDEFALLYNISLIPFSKRDIESISSKLGEGEKEILNAMVASRKITLVEKDGKRYIQFPSELYSKLKAHSAGAGAAPQASAAPIRIGDYAVFSRDDFNSFYRGSAQNTLRSLAIIPWFDGKVYVALRGWVQGWAPKAIEALRKRGDASTEELAEEMKMSADGARTVAISLCNEGLAVESRKGRYSLAE